MPTTYTRIGLAVLLLSCFTSLTAQQVLTTSSATKTLSAVPHLVRLSSSFRPADGRPAAAVEGISLSIYKDEKGGTPLWQETQNVPLDTEGRYTVLLGMTQTDGVPSELFSSGEPRWLGVQFERPGEAEQPRVLMASVPYALKAADAETLGGRPASAYMLAPSADPTVPAANRATPSSAASGSGSKTVRLTPQIDSGTPGSIGVFTSSTDLGSSVMFQSGARIGLGTTSPFDYLHVAFTDTSGGFAGYAVQNFGFGANAYSGMLFYDQNGALGQFQGFNNSTHEYRINNIAKSGANFNGSINFMIGGSSKFLVASNGNIGIGTSSPSQPLDVNGNIEIDGTGNGVIFPDGSKIGSGMGVAFNWGGVATFSNAYSTFAPIALSGNLTISTNQPVAMNAVAEIGSSAGNTLFLYSCYIPSGGPFILVGDGLFDLNLPAGDRRLFAINQVFTGLPAGTYNFGMCACVGNPGSPANINDYYYVTAMALPVSTTSIAAPSGPTAR